jgi:ANTAR domain/PAS fold
MADGSVEKAASSPVSPSVPATPLQVGWVRYFFEPERWEWSPEVARLHGYDDGVVVPTTELVLSHKHPDDLPLIAATLETIRLNSQPFCTQHRIIDTRGVVHNVVVGGDQIFGDDGTVIGTNGYYVDITPIDQGRQKVITEAVSEIAENRGVIEQTKGMLMMVYGVSADAAFKLLQWRSQETNVKLRVIAERIATDFTGTFDGAVSQRSKYDQLLLTAHLRVES